MATVSEETAALADRLDLWLTGALEGRDSSLPEFADGLSDEERAEFERRLPGLRASINLLSAAAATTTDDDTTFLPRGKAGRYEVIRRIAGGGMGILCLALDLELDREVAYKVLRPKLKSLDLAHKLFLREAEITAGLSHPGVVKILGRVEDECDLPAYAMELVQGPSLEEIIARYQTLRDREERRLARKELLGHFIATCAAVDHAHRASVIHGDIKASNIHVDATTGATKLLDWGLARRLADGEIAKGGTPVISSPSVIDGAATSVGSDVYALGFLLGQMLERPSRRERGQPRALTSHPAFDTPNALWAIVEKAKRFDQKDRYPSAHELAADVEKVMEDEPVSVYRDPPATRARRFVRRHAMLCTLLASAVLLASLTAAAVFRISRMSLSQRQLKELIAEQEEAVLRSEIIADTYVAAPNSIVSPTQKLESMGRAIFTLNMLSKRFSEKPAYLQLLAQWRYIRAKLYLDGAFPGGPSEALADLDLAISVLDPLLARFPDAKVPPLDVTKLTLEMGLIPEQSDLNLRVALGSCHLERANALVRLDRPTEALMSLDRAISLDDGTRRAALQLIHRGLILTAMQERSRQPWLKESNPDYAKVILLAEYLASQKGVIDGAIYNAACDFALASRDPKASPAERATRADRAMAYLRQIAARGYFKPRATGLGALLSSKDTLDELRKDFGLNPLRDRADFKALLANPTGRPVPAPR